MLVNFGNLGIELKLSPPLLCHHIRYHVHQGSSISVLTIQLHSWHPPLRSWLQSLLAVLKQIAAISDFRLVPPTANKKMSVLQTLGEIHPWSGYLTPCFMQNVDATATTCPGIRPARYNPFSSVRHKPQGESQGSACRFGCYARALPCCSQV